MKAYKNRYHDFPDKDIWIEIPDDYDFGMFSISRQVFKCSKCDELKHTNDTTSKITRHDMFGGAMDFVHICNNCGTITEEYSAEKKEDDYDN